MDTPVQSQPEGSPQPVEAPAAILEDLEESYLRFYALEDPELAQITSGPRLSCSHRQPKSYYGPVTIRNYLAGHFKKLLRKSQDKHTPDLSKQFLRLPIELKLQVLEHLHPIDLYHFGQATKHFRKIIMSRKSAGVWKAAFELHPDLPLHPPNTTYSEWAFMLFGPGICAECGKHGALTDFSFCKRICEPCMAKVYIYSSAVTDMSGNAILPEHVIWTLIPRTFRYNGLRYTLSYSNTANARFLRTDFEPMIKKVTILQLLVDGEVPGMAEIFEEWKESLITSVNEINSRAEKANSWALDVYRQSASDYDTAVRENAETCKKRLLNLGHEPLDVNYVQSIIGHALRSELIYKLTPRAFRKVRPRLEEAVVKRKVERLKVERQMLLESLYNDWRKTVDPDEWQYHPPPVLVNTIAGFSEFLNADYKSRGDVTPAYAATLFPDFVESWTSRQRDKIVQLLPALPDVTDEDLDSKLRRMELVTSVFSCHDCRYREACGWALIGWKNICQHRCIQPFGRYFLSCKKIVFEENLSAAAASLVSCLGLDPRTTTLEDMAGRDARFLCGNCTSERSNGVTGLKAYRWMECISHAAQMTHNAMHDTPAWLLLTPEATRFVREHEYPHPRENHEVWRCNLCATHFELRVTQGVAVMHVQSTHSIDKPVIGKDVVYDKRQSIRRRKPFRLGLDPAYEFQCKRCPKIGITKLWEMQALVLHLRLKHQVFDSVEGEDWAKVHVIAAAAAAVPTPADPEPQPDPQPIP
ncbi:hypothetical protein B0H34DRAFT_325856 [Crassisporium funariophilum]|nr:hypothetical protein B0H34DRAFT_325856 [Crassisporium funariophilum]